MLGFSMSLNRFHIYLISLLLTLLIPTIVLADKPSAFPVKKFRMSKQTITLSRLSTIEAKEIVTNGNVALINSRRNLWLMKAKDNKLKKKEIRTNGNISTWYGVTCAMNDGFVIAVNDYPEAQKDKENKSPLGGYRAGPKTKGFILLSETATDRYLRNLIITSRPSNMPKVSSEGNFSDHVESCAWDGKKMVIGSYGSLGIANFNTGTIDLIDEDEDCSYNRFPLLVENKAIWVWVDEGGMGGAWLEMRPRSGKTKQYTLRTKSTDEQFIYVTALLRHKGNLFVGTNYGLFSLDEQSGNFWRLSFGMHLAEMPVTTLLSHEGFLWVFIGEAWLRVDIANHKAVRYVDSMFTQLKTGSPFGEDWLLSGPSGLWKYSARPTERHISDP
jgi:hypothetical protein